ncbi:MAG: toxin-antitoxin system YwqK family antitoxin [Bacteroidia bacterium]
MKIKFVSSIIIALSWAVLPAAAQNGFTNKAEAKNMMKDSLKEGKWVEYFDENQDTTSDTSQVVYYSLTEYKAGNPVGIVREYYKSGKLYSETPYSADGHIDGVLKNYYESGVLSYMVPYVYGKKEGVERYYYPDGKIQSETKYDSGLPEVSKKYNEDGTEMK